ncbi:LLM class flavin-dependent oxidoreductase [Streptomyces sp. NPDC051018]|uniref:LLM class flavin-dependent oxidoreductase n=1 Tax=Streptomyces sp. NPDC051018 TaxID=3365639 RepID=UPI0037987BFF
MTGARRLHLAVRLPDTGADGGTGGRADFASLVRSARTAERGLFDFLLLGGGTLPYGAGDGVHDGVDAALRPEPVTLLSALAAVTDRLGLAAAVLARTAEPFTAARALASLDHLSGGRAAWHMADPPGAGGRAEEFIRTARRLWDSWPSGGEARPFSHSGPYFTTEGEFTLPRPPQGHPVIIRAAVPGEDPEEAAGVADVLITRYEPQGPPGTGRASGAGAVGGSAAHEGEPGGRSVMADRRTLAEVTVVLGASDAEARERAAEIRRRRIPAERAIPAVERIRGRDLPDGPIPGLPGVPGPHGSPGPQGSPGFDPAPDSVLTGRRVPEGDRGAIPEAGERPARETVAEASGRQSFIGTPGRVAAAMEEYVRGGAADGFVLVPQPGGGGLGEFVAGVVPLLQERGVFRTRYTGTTLRSHLGLTEPVWKG